MSEELRQNLPVLPFASPQVWERWLAENHAGCSGVWVKFAKKSTGIASVTYEEARDVALCYGWIDGLKHGYDETHYLIRFLPRRPKSIWSKVNVGIAESLIASGRMRPAGLAEVERAKADGRWEAAYDSQATMQVPDDFRAALSEVPQALAFFETLKSSSRYAFLYRIQTARTPELRAKRIRDFVGMLERGEAFHLI